MTLSLHKLWAGSGYDYLTRQVARLDATHPGRGSLASYYSERGETPGIWVGAGMSGVDGLAVGDVVTAEQMRHLFAHGRHPLATLRQQTAREAGASEREVAAAGQLGSPFRTAGAAGSGFRAEVDRRLAARLKPDATPVVAADVRARVVSEVAAEWFARDHGRAPVNTQELAGAVARWSRPAAKPVAGFDLTFSPVKSVSALWAVADLPVAAEIERAHQAAVAEALRFVEQRALFTREGTNGVRQVDVHGLVGAAFTHRDSRAGDPDLHTHVAVANKVQTRQGKWLAVDGRALYPAVVAASETYNTALEAQLGERLGIVFAERSPSGERRPVREVVGVDPALLARWSSRRQAVDVRREELTRSFQNGTGRPPTREEAWRLAQQATLETRPRKHEPRTLHEQRQAWTAQAVDILGSADAVAAMVQSALSPTPIPTDAASVDAEWVADAAARVLAVLEGERATWQPWHLHAEALRQVRGTAPLPAGLTGHVVDLVAAEVVNRSVPLHIADSVAEPEGLRRADGTSVYGRAGTASYTSARILAAEGRVLAAAARRDGRRVDPADVDVALARAAVDDVALNDGQAGLVRALLTSGARVGLALAPAGTGKTTALRVLAATWTASGGSVVGLAPTAAAAGVLGEQLDGPADTLAKLVWHLQHPEAEQPAWVGGVGPGTLVLVDEAGLADTLSLEVAIAFVVGRGGSVRLIGDDRQLGAVGAGGLLRDLDAHCGAARLAEVVRFADPAEAAASLALREGRPEALGFYLDEHRVHVGDPTTSADQLFAAWTADQAAGLDSLMLAPTHTLVADLNARARTHCLHGSDPDVEVGLADGNRASPGEVILTRRNDRQLRTSRTGWVRNGDRWTVDHVHPDGSLTATSGRRTVRLPADYVAAWVQLGYASTVHAAQGLTCDTVHGLVTGQESRAQLYTLLTRGRTANHLYLTGDDTTAVHALNRPGDPPPATPTEVLERVLARDDTARSATSHRRDQHDPAHRLGRAAARYTDALHDAASQASPADLTAQVDAVAEHLQPGLTQEPAWPTLRSALLLRGLHGDDPTRRLRLAVATAPLTAAHDRAAVLHARVTATTRSGSGPLPWLSRIPPQLERHPTWGPYLHARATLVSELAETVHADSLQAGPPAWAADLGDHLPPRLVAEIEVWRATAKVAVDDLRPTGPTMQSGPPGEWQRRFDQQLNRACLPHEDWMQRLDDTMPSAITDSFQGRLAGHLARLAAAGVDLDQPLLRAAAQGTLPDDHAAAALWWRLHRHLPQLAAPPKVRSESAPVLPDPAASPEPAPPHVRAARTSPDAEKTVDSALLIAGLLRLAASSSPAARRVATPSARREHTTEETTDRSRLLQINERALSFYRAQLTGSWSEAYLWQRCGVDLSDDDRFQPGHAPSGWTALATYLRRSGVSDDEMLRAGVVTRASGGHVVDRFRDRLVLPIRNRAQELVGFVGRRNPDADHKNDVPKYLNTPNTGLSTKGEQLYGSHLLASPRTGRALREQAPAGDVVPVLVEGPFDAIAVTLAGGGRYLGVAPLGTALTSPQAAQIATAHHDPVLANDPDRSGRAATDRDFWLLAQHHVDPRAARLPEGLDPAALLAERGPGALVDVLATATRHGDQILANPASSGRSRRALVNLVAARPPHTWAASLETLSIHLDVPEQTLREELLPLVHEWTSRPASVAQTALAARAVRHSAQGRDARGPAPEAGRRQDPGVPR